MMRSPQKNDLAADLRAAQARIAELERALHQYEAAATATHEVVDDRFAAELYRSLIEVMDVSLCRWLPDTTLIYTNEKYRTLFGLSNDATHQKWLDFLPEESRAATAAVYAQLAVHPRQLEYEHPVVLADGSVREYQWIDTPIFDVNGRLIQFQSVGIDTTARKQAETALRLSEERYRGLIESLDSVVGAIDAGGQILYLNDIAAIQLNGSPNSFVGRTLHELLPPHQADQLLARVRTAITEDRSVIYEAPQTVYDVERWYRTTIQPIHDEQGQVLFALVNATDIHDLKMAQQALQELNRSLEERVRQRTAEVQNLLRIKDEFLANMSHEFRTPLNNILTLTEIMLDQVYGPLNERQLHSMRNLEASGQRLQTLISNLLDVVTLQTTQGAPKS